MAGRLLCLFGSRGWAAGGYAPAAQKPPPGTCPPHKGPCICFGHGHPPATSPTTSTTHRHSAAAPPRGNRQCPKAPPFPLAAGRTPAGTLLVPESWVKAPVVRKRHHRKKKRRFKASKLWGGGLFLRHFRQCQRSGGSTWRSSAFGAFMRHTALGILSRWGGMPAALGTLWAVPFPQCNQPCSPLAGVRGCRPLQALNT